MSFIASVVSNVAKAPLFAAPQARAFGVLAYEKAFH